MAIRAEKQKKILDILKNLPPEKVDEIIDFAEYLEKNKQPFQRIKKKTAPLELPSFHLGRISKQATDRDRLYGEYLDRKFA